MANLNMGFDPSELPEPDNSFDPLPAGEYPCTIEAVECKQSNKNANNWYLNIRFSVIGADYSNRKIFEIVNFKNDNPTAEQIGAQTLGQIIRATGIQWRGDSDDLIGGNCYVKVSIKNDPTYGAQNAVKGHRTIDLGAPAPAMPNAPGVPSAPPTGFSPPAAAPQGQAPGARKPPFFGKK